MGFLIKKKNWKLITLFLFLLFLLGSFIAIEITYPVNWGILFYSGKSTPVLSEQVYIENITNDMLIHSVKQGTCWASRGNTIYVSQDEGHYWKKKGTLPYSIFNLRYLKNYYLGRKIFNKHGIDKMLVLDSGTVLLFSGPDMWRYNPSKNSFKIVHNTRTPPFPQGWTESKDGILYGEYGPNKDRRKVNLWKSFDDGISWSIINTIPAGSVRHIHAVQYDSYEDWIWVATGDEDFECKIMYSTDGGKTFNTIGEGSQEWRAVSLIFTENFVYWGMDGGYRRYIYKWNRKSHEREAVAEIDGPAYFSTKLEDGSLIIGTTVETGYGEWDRSAHIWFKKRSITKWVDLASWKKIPGLKDFGILRLAYPNETSSLYLSPTGTEGHYTIIQLKIERE